MVAAIFILILILFLPDTLLPLLKTILTLAEQNEMGLCLEDLPVVPA